MIDPPASARAVTADSSILIRGEHLLRLAKILYIASALRVRPRVIDRYIDYFGERTSRER